MADFFGAVPCLNVTNPRQVAERIKIMLDNEDWGEEPWKLKRKLIVDTHDQTWKRILYHMDMLPVSLLAGFDPHRVYASQ
jgi:hypothetical protein